jgi:hypothetical protein
MMPLLSYDDDGCACMLEGYQEQKVLPAARMERRI